MAKKIEISHRTIIFTVFFLISLYLLYQIRHILVALFVSLIVMSALTPAVDRLEKLKIPRVLSILVVYFLILGFLGITVAGIVPPLIDQTTTLIVWFPDYVDSLGLPTVDHNIIASQIDQLGSIPASLLKIIVTLFSNLLSFFVLAVITFYLLIERKNLNQYLSILFGSGGEERAKRFVDELEGKLGGWVRAQTTLMFIVSLMAYFGLRLLGIDFALPLALLAGVLEIVPNIGPVLSAVPAVLAGLVISPLMGLGVVALYFLIQQIENTLIVPQVMKKKLGLNPLVTILSLAIGFKLAGIAGAVLAIPVMLLVQAVATETFASKKLNQV